MLEAFVPAVILLAIIKKVVDWLRFLRGKDYDSALTQVAVWIVAVGVILLTGETDFANDLAVGDGGDTLASLNTWSLIFVGLGIGSTASLVEDIITPNTPKPPLVQLSSSRRAEGN